MVSLNLTFFVLLLLFLGFLWAMHRFVFKPALALTDQREAQVANAKSEAIENSKEATSLEDAYAMRIGAIHREANLRLSQARHSAQEKHNEQVDAFRKRAEEELRGQRKFLRAEVKEQTQQIGPLAADLAAAMAARLELE